MRRRSVREKSLSAVARSTIGLIQRLSLEVTVWIMPVNVLSALDVKSLSAARHPSDRSEEHTSELQSLMRISYAVFCLKKKKTKTLTYTPGNCTNYTANDINTN